MILIASSHTNAASTAVNMMTFLIDVWQLWQWRTFLVHNWQQWQWRCLVWFSHSLSLFPWLPVTGTLKKPFISITESFYICQLVVWHTIIAGAADHSESDSIWLNFATVTSTFLHSIWMSRFIHGLSLLKHDGQGSTGGCRFLVAKLVSSSSLYLVSQSKVLNIFFTTWLYPEWLHYHVLMSVFPNPIDWTGFVTASWQLKTRLSKSI